MASKSFTFANPLRAGHCEIRGGYSLTINSDGTWRAIGHYHCNAGGITSCDHTLKNVLDAGGAAVASFTVLDKDTAGPGSTRDIDKSGSDNSIKDNYNAINLAHRDLDCDEHT